MHTLTLVDLPDEHGKPRAYEFTFPGAWEELTPMQLGQMVLLRSSGVHESAIRYRMLRTLASIPKRLFHRMNMGDVMEFVPGNGGQVHVVKELNYLFTDPVFEKSLVPEFKLASSRSVAGIRVGGSVRWQGPKNQLKNFTVLQFAMADHCLQVLQTSKTTESLNNFLGATYLPEVLVKDKDGERLEVQKWDSKGIEPRGLELSVLPLHLKLAAVFNYQAVRAALPLRFPHTFGKRKGDDPMPDFGIDGLIEGIAGDKFGTVDVAGDKPLHPALINCERAMITKEQIDQAREDQ